MKLTVVVSVQGKTDTYMSRVDAFPEHPDCCNEDLMKELVSVMAVDALEEIVTCINKDLG